MTAAIFACLFWPMALLHVIFAAERRREARRVSRLPGRSYNAPDPEVPQSAGGASK